MADWSELPNDILGLIADRLLFLLDLYHFASVCTSWRPIALEKRHLSCQRPPLLMLPYEEDSATCSFISISNMETCKIFLPELRNKWCCGSSYGWLFTMDDDLEIYLLNPLSRVQVKLPPHPMFPDIIRRRKALGEKSDIWKYEIIHKVMLSDDPISNPNFLIMAIVSEYDECTFCRPGDKTWTSFKDWFKHYRCFCNAAIYDEKIYAVCVNSIGVEFNINTLSVAQLVLDIPHARKDVEDIRYVVKSGEEILYILRYWTIIPHDEDGQEQLQDSGNDDDSNDDEDNDDDDDDSDEEEDEEDGNYFRTPFYRTVGFDVYKLELLKPGYEWIEVKSLGDRALFLDRGHCLSIYASDSNKCKANCIYFLDDNFYDCMRTIPRCSDTGIFNMVDGSIEPLPIAPLWSTPAIWLTQ
ncbi:F-box protein At2g26160 [Elaeis guineensis]|uniref:F-box protein At2g26160 n=1 Tax=Elaeis guineensis var. tenera TaxID=51953 RepID=UPI003C6D6E47